MDNIQDVYWYEGHELAETFWSPYEDYKKYIGKKFTIVRRMTEKECDIETLPSWIIKFDSGEEIQALPEEIIKSEIERNGGKINETS